MLTTLRHLIREPAVVGRTELAQLDVTREGRINETDPADLYDRLPHRRGKFRVAEGFAKKIQENLKISR
ncbi:MAG: hypothetical protein OSA84_05940 [Akkermansiaceae bacterium]|nr:hypothetical protein [Akkermansiaceae bacterium]